MPPIREDVVTYLQTHLTEFPVEELRRQLAGEGVSETEFDEALKVALRAPGGVSKPSVPAKAPNKSRAAGKILLLIGFVSIALAAVLAIKGTGDVEHAVGPATAPSTGGAASAYVGRAGWVVRLPGGYATTLSPKSHERLESVFFHRAGLDSTNLLDEGLFGPLGIVRLEVQPSPFLDVLSPVDALTAATTARAKERGEKFSIKPITVTSLKGIQLTFEAPSARIETYVVGQRSLYAFYAGQDDDVYREILMSLRDTASEN